MSVAVGLIAAAAGILALIFAIDGNSEALGMAGVCTYRPHPFSVQDLMTALSL